MKLTLSILLLTISALACAQERNDSVSVLGSGLSDMDIEELTRPIGNPSNTLEPMVGIQPESGKDIEVLPDLSPEVQVPDLHFSVVEKGSRLPRWATGYMYGSNGWQSSLLYGYTAHSSIGVQQALGKYWSINAGLQLQKYSVYYNTATFDGSVTWHPNEHFGITAFGSYMPGSFMSVSDIGPSFQWGGYITLKSDSPWGIDLGARQTYDAYSGHEVLPIVQPFFMMGGAKLGFDLGPMIKNAIDSKHHGNNGASPIPRPQKAMPPVVPRR